MSSHRASFYVQLRAERAYGDTVTSVGAVALTKGKPGTLRRDTVAVRLTVELPDDVFDAFTAEATVVVPSELVQHPITVQAVDAGGRA